MARKPRVEKSLENALYLGEPVAHIEEWRVARICTLGQLVSLSKLKLIREQVRIEYANPGASSDALALAQSRYDTHMALLAESFNKHAEGEGQ